MNKLVVQPKGVVFDVGNVLLDWNPDYLYRKLLPDPEERAWFLTHVCSMSWHGEQDRGRPCSEGTAELVARFPGYEAAIAAFYDRWLETIGGPVEGMEELVDALLAAGTPVFALSNFPQELWDATVEAYPFLGRLDGRVLSGEENVSKPDRRIYDILAERMALKPAQLVFIDDRDDNLATAYALGFRCVLIEGRQSLEAELAEMGLPVAPARWADPAATGPVPA